MSIVIGRPGISFSGGRVGAPIPGKSPAQIASLLAWYRAGDIALANDDPVATWPDRDGGYHATAAGAARPTYKTNVINARPSVRFDGANHYMLTANASSPAQAQPTTIFVVGRANTLAAGVLLDGGFGTAFRHLVSRAQVLSADWGEWFCGTNPYINSASATADPKFNIICAQFNGASSFVRVGGLQVASGNAGTNALAGISLGARGVNPSTKLNGDLAEVAVFGAALLLADIQAVEAYMGARYARNIDGSTWNIVFEGDSRTVSDGGSYTYPKQCIYNYIPSVPRCRINMTNAATSGHTLADMWSGRATTAALYDATKARNILVLWGGTNDFGAGTDEATVLTRLLDLVDYFYAAGFELVVCTELPRGDVSKPVGFDANRAAYNGHIRDNAAAHHYTVADLAADSRIGDDGDEDDTTYYNVDKIHMTQTGYGVVAEIVSSAIESL